MKRVALFTLCILFMLMVNISVFSFESSTVSVSSAEELLQAIAQAEDGDTIYIDIGIMITSDVVIGDDSKHVILKCSENLSNSISSMLTIMNSGESATIIQNVTIDGNCDPNNLFMTSMITIEDGNVKIIDSTFKNCYSYCVNGAAINFRSQNKFLEINGCTFVNNVAQGSCGGHLALMKGSSMITNSYFSQGSGFEGGAIFNYAELVIHNSKFENNTAILNGGAISSVSDSTCEIEDNSVVMNNNASYGGGIYSNYSLHIGSNVKLYGNIASSYGSDIFSVGRSTVLTNTDELINSFVDVNLTPLGWYVDNEYMRYSQESQIPYNTPVINETEPAHLIFVCKSSEPEPSPSPTPELTPSPEPTPTVTLTPAPTVTPEPTTTPIPTIEPTPVPTATPSPIPIPEVSPSPSPTVAPTPVPEITPSPSPISSPTPQPTPVPTPQPTAVPTPWPTYAPDNYVPYYPPIYDNTPEPPTYTEPIPDIAATHIPEIAVAVVPDIPYETTPPTPEPWINPFADVDEGDWFYEAAKFVHQNGLFSGTSATTFSPNATTTRGMMVTVLWRLFGCPTTTNEVFTDVSNGEWYANAVNWAAANKIVGGIGNNLFAPNDDVTREQMAVILYNYTKFISIELPKNRVGIFNDDMFINAWARDAVNAMYGAEILNGKADMLFDPQGKATRAEVAMMFKNFVECIQKHVDKTSYVIE